MKYNFSSDFLKILPPDSSFGEAWESLCHHLLCQEHGHNGFIRLNPPDRGIDIFHQPERRAYQCKSHENGAAATIDATKSIKSLKTAVAHRNSFEWSPYCFATNANFSGVGFEKILSTATELGIDKKLIEHLGPEYWSSLCEKRSTTIGNRFDFRIQVSEEQVIEAFRKARYYDEYVSKYGEEIKKANFTLVISNNRTPTEIEIPFSPELSVEQYLDVAKSLMGISLDWTNFDDLNTSAGPSISVTIDKKAQSFSKKIKELPVKPGDKLEIWIKIVWKDEKKDGAAASSDMMVYKLHYLNLSSTFKKTAKSYQERRQVTVDRKEEIIQSMIWDSVSNLVAHTK